MDRDIEVYECLSGEDRERFWLKLREYFRRDIFPGEESCYHCSDEYKNNIENLRRRRFDPARYLFFRRGGEEIGLALTVVYASEDGKQFILEFCVYPEQRARGEPLMLLPPQEDAPMTVGLANGIEEFWALELSFFAAVGETPPDSMGRSRMIGAMSAGRVAFITVKRLNRPIGLCSVSRCFSSFTCWDMGVLDDFYIEPAFRGKGAARLLVEKAAEYCRKQGMQSLAVTCSDVDLELYRALGFTTRLGTNLTMPLPYES